MSKKDLNKEIKKLFTSNGSDPFKMEITPYRDWRIMTGIFFVGLAASLGFNIYMSIRINQDSFFATAPKAGEGVSLNKAGLSKILEEFAGKEALSEKAKTEKPIVVDPSL